MATKIPLVIDSTGAKREIASSDTIPAANLPEMVGDSGSGGTKGAVPAPAAGDASAGYVLKADGTWGAPASEAAANKVFRYQNFL